MGRKKNVERRKKMELTREPSPAHVIHELMVEPFVHGLHQDVQQDLEHIDDSAGCENCRCNY